VRLRYTREAIADLDGLLDHIVKHSPQGGRRVQGRIKAVMDLLLQHPQIGQMTSRRGMRRMVASPYPYLIFYRATEDEIVIHGVRHASRKPSSMPGSG
jgi:plasmid stabilization system protein ParE